MKKTTYTKLAGLSLAVISALGLSAAEATKTIELDVDSSSDLITILNLAGEVTVRPSSDDSVHITGIVTATADDKDDAEDLLDSIAFDTDNKRGEQLITVTYPVDDYTGFVYNPNNKKNSFWSGNFNTNSRYMGEKVRVASKEKGIFSNWANVHTDLTIELPAEQLSKVKLLAGKITAADLNNSLTLDSSSGKIQVTDSQGQLTADTGSGGIVIENFAGDVDADTGSGGVTLSNINGDIEADTGSGGIKINKVTGNVTADTGSGGVTVNEYLGGEKIEIDTGSGGVRVNGDLGNVNELEIDTGSGGVKIVTSHPPSLDIDIDVGSGSINVDLPNLEVKKDKRGTFLGTAGNGDGKASIDTGSGSVSFKMDESYSGSYTNSSKKVKPKDSDADTNKSQGVPNPELAAKVRAALNEDKDLRNADLNVTAVDDRVMIKGTIDSMWDIAKAIKLANDVDGVESINVDIETDED